ncbi:NADH-quinone oxidoreductase subunit 8 [Lacunisphaera limnophila]|uniref:NADH-quinone oxidoreductase subunit H n=1 Tax=Lacunisphaera limnophila TaxID=1838286 RepID=A0A1D8AV73_9BACT|nr:complex I subunit 1 family protein [Lacunisphaera limnophila]AOS44799.1 NADH-quinone oxidoreductase subunit 8 [Lacunisphaera limnophila]
MSLETLPLIVRDWIVALFPDVLQWLVHHLLSIAVILTVFGLFFAFTTIAERKLLGRLQNRLGPNRAGLPKLSILPFHLKHKLWGLSQPFADAVKALTKEDVVPDAADKVLHFLAPVVIVAFSLLGFAVLPFGRHLIPVELDAGLLYFFAAGTATELAIFMAGWGSRNKYSLLAAMRALAQLISYELPLILSVVPVVLVVGTLSLPDIAVAQSGWTFGVLPHWHVFTPWGFAGFLIFLVAALAESNRSPFDLPEAESELIAGHLTEYSGFKYALFFMAEYFGLTALSGLGVTIFLGGWQAPFAFLEFIPSYLWFMMKLAGMIVFFIWIRGTLLRLRIDQLTRLSWQFLVPLALLNLANAAFWALTAGWSGPLVFVRWAVSAAIVVVPFLILGRRLSGDRAPRTYRYAS